MANRSEHILQCHSISVGLQLRAKRQLFPTENPGNRPILLKLKLFFQCLETISTT